MIITLDFHIAPVLEIYCIEDGQFLKNCRFVASPEYVHKKITQQNIKFYSIKNCENEKLLAQISFCMVFSVKRR